MKNRKRAAWLALSLLFTPALGAPAGALAAMRRSAAPASAIVTWSTSGEAG